VTGRRAPPSSSRIGLLRANEVASVHNRIEVTLKGRAVGKMAPAVLSLWCPRLV
jgi:hypothetical protein